MAYTLTKPAPRKGDLTPKNRVWQIFSESNNSRPRNRRQVQQLHRKNRPTPTKTVSGIPVWPSRDPIGERGGSNVYSVAENDIINKYDIFGLKAGCSQSEIDNIVNNDPTVTFWIEQLKNKKTKAGKPCIIPKIVCAECPCNANGDVPGGLHRRGLITICSNGPDRLTDTLEDYLRHELIHAWDVCDGADPRKCADAICMEIRAYIAMNPDKNSKWAIKSRVKNSMSHRPECESSFDELFETWWPGCSASTGGGGWK